MGLSDGGILTIFVPNIHFKLEDFSATVRRRACASVCVCVCVCVSEKDRDMLMNSV
jgi:hypothetical protein